MPTEADHQEIEIHIEYHEFIAGRELSEILELLDATLWYELLYEFERDYFPPHFLYRHGVPRMLDEQPPSLFCVKEISKGSLLITGFLGGAAATYCFNRFKKGFRPKRFGEQIERLGRVAGDHLEAIVERMNLWLEEYVAEAKEKNSRIKSIRAKRKNSRNG
jgi:hypothetical protein